LIVVSGALVLVALVLLIIGLLGTGLLLIWLSIATSAVAAVFLLLGALQRRGAPAAAGESMMSGPDMLERVTAVSVRPREDAAGAAPVAAAETPASAGEVSVVPGRPRYHTAACRFLSGRPDVQSMPVEEARTEGYTACGVCKPDAALAAAPEPAAEPAEPVADETSDDTMVDTGAAAMAEPADEPLTEPIAAPARKPAKRAAATKSTAGRTATATATPAKAAKPAAKKAATATGTGQVVVIPDRGKFHTETCRFVKDVPGTVNLTKAAAKRQGYTPCGVCKP
jgi:hypothetical protein